VEGGISHPPNYRGCRQAKEEMQKKKKKKKKSQRTPKNATGILFSS
jgi:hypothetical protein